MLGYWIMGRGGKELIGGIVCWWLILVSDWTKVWNGREAIGGIVC